MAEIERLRWTFAAVSSILTTARQVTVLRSGVRRKTRRASAHCRVGRADARHLVETTTFEQRRATGSHYPRPLDGRDRHVVVVTGQPLVRRYGVGDAAATWTVFHAAVHETASRDYTSEQVEAWAPPCVDEDGWHEHRAEATTFVACLSDSIVGFSDFSDFSDFHPTAAKSTCSTCTRRSTVEGWPACSSRQSCARQPPPDISGFAYKPVGRLCRPS